MQIKNEFQYFQRGPQNQEWTAKKIDPLPPPPPPHTFSLSSTVSQIQCYKFRQSFSGSPEMFHLEPISNRTREKGDDHQWSSLVRYLVMVCKVTGLSNVVFFKTLELSVKYPKLGLLFCIKWEVNLENNQSTWRKQKKRRRDQISYLT